MPIKDHMVLCLSGFDPTAGAGILADIKTIETTGAYGMGITTANTIQTEQQFISNQWANQEYLIKQLNNLLNTYNFKVAKIGIIENLNFLNKLIEIIKSKNPEIDIIWDPVLKSTSGFEFHSEINSELLNTILSKITLVTPNIPEYKILFGDLGLRPESKYNSSLLLKGGHDDNEQIVDKLYSNNQEFLFYGTKSNYPKHGTGCILSSAISSYLAQGKSLIDACEKAKNYINLYLDSDKSLLGKHILPQ